MMKKFEFLTSVRFWKLFAASFVEFLAAQGYIDPAFAHALAAWLVGSVAVRTIDRLGESTPK